MKTIIRMISSGFYLGYSPIASGTLASILGLLIYLGLYRFPAIYIIVVMLLFVLGFIVCGRAEKIFGEKDSKRIVIDEIASICLVYLFIKPTWFMLILGFFLFRIFDIIKPPPAKRIEALSGSRGVMLDDVVAACYTIIIFFLLYAAKEAGIFPEGYGALL